MEKEKKSETKKSMRSTKKKVEAKKEPKKVVKKVGTKKKILNETNEEIKKEPIIVTENENMEQCIYCHELFEKGYTICPHCHKRQKDNKLIVGLIIFAVCFLLVIIFSYFIGKESKALPFDDYVTKCSLVDYESLVRSPKNYLNNDIKIIGEVTSVTGTDTGLGNEMIITINGNLFDTTKNENIEIEFSDKNYEQGFIEGDVITIYGVYDAINGNTPHINAKHIKLGK